MKTRAWFCLTALIGVPALFAVQAGDLREDVRAELGHPMGELELGDRVRWLYPEGDVTFIDGVVTEHRLKGPEAMAREAAAKARQAADRAAWREADRAQRLAQGRDWLARAQAGLVQPRDLQKLLRHWQALRSDYPEAVPAAEFAATVTAVESALVRAREAEEAARLAALETRVAVAEARAAQAEAQAERSYFRVGYSSWPMYCPPTRPVVVITGGNACAYPARPRPAPRAPLLQASFQTGNVSVRYSSGPGFSW